MTQLILITQQVQMLIQLAPRLQFVFPDSTRCLENVTDDLMTENLITIQDGSDFDQTSHLCQTTKIPGQKVSRGCCSSSSKVRDSSFLYFPIFVSSSTLASTLPRNENCLGNARIFNALWLPAHHVQENGCPNFITLLFS